MRDITEKEITLRTARATGQVECAQTTAELWKEGTLPKGDPVPVARAAAFLAAKKTADLIPHCHPLPLESLQVDFELLEETPRPDRASIRITVAGKTRARTGLEMEVLTAVSVAALTLYDLLKPVDKDVSIERIRLLEKTGGKSGDIGPTRRS